MMWLLLLTCAVSAEPINYSEVIVKDGDTIIFRGTTFRMVGYDTPEIYTRRRTVGANERALAELATERFKELLKSGPIDLTEVPCSCPRKKIEDGTCNYGRKCGVLKLNGENVGDILIREELARPFVCRKTNCPRMPDWPSIAGDR